MGAGKKAINQRKQRKQGAQRLVHPQSRKAGHLNDKNIRRIKGDLSDDRRDRKYKAMIHKYIWFTNRAPEKPIGHAELAELTKEYISRFTEAKEVLMVEKGVHKKLKRVIRASLNSKEDMFNMAIELEANKFGGGGVEVPDLLTKLGLNSLLDWDESIQFLPQVKTVMCKESWLKNENDQTENAEKAEMD